MKKKFSEQFKQEAIAHALAHTGKPLKAIAQELGVGYSTLDSWLRVAQPAIEGATRRAPSAEQQRIRQLEKENAHLREVNEIIKKAHVYFVNNPSR
jgi:transposase-like protein